MVIAVSNGAALNGLSAEPPLASPVALLGLSMPGFLIASEIERSGIKLVPLKTVALLSVADNATAPTNGPMPAAPRS